MRVPLSWLGESVELAPGATPEQVHADLVRVGFEEESIRRFEVSGPVVVGEVLSAEPEPQSNGKTINWCQVRVASEGQTAADGGADVRGIVCGAHNFGPGDRVVVTLPGAVLPGDFRIAARKTYGHVSDGMIASARELSLGEDHEGIIVLSRLGLDETNGAVIGADALALLGLDESAVEINVTPDRGYAFSVRGVAREYGHATGAPFTDPAAAVSVAEATGFPVVLQDEAPIRGRAGATGFIARVVRGIDATRPTPPWMVSRLQLAGVRALSLPVDISNYVMLELGQPLHAYDLSKLDGGITVRRARAGERLQTLDEQDRELHPEDLVIADDAGAVGLAGVMGGQSTKTDETTTDILVEAATFDPVSIARTARRHKLPSEASKRFERGVDPLVAAAAAQRMVDLLVELAGGTADDLGATLVAEWQPTPVRLRIARVNGLLGTDYTPEEIRGALEMIGCTVALGAAGDPDLWFVTPPSWRSDLTRSADLVEEVARIVGYDRIPSVLPVAPAGRGLTRAQRLRRRAANTVTAAGFDEVQNYPFVSRAQLDAFGSGPSDVATEASAPVSALALANPLDGEAPFLRRSLLPGLIGAVQRNASRGLTDLSLVEFGAVFVPVAPGAELGTESVPPLGERPADAVLAQLDAVIPEQPLRVAAVLTGLAEAKQPGLGDRAYDWADALDAARTVAGAVAAELVVRQGSHRAFHPGRTAELFVRTEQDAELELVGVAGELLPDLVADHHLHGRAAAFELDLGRLIAIAPQTPETGPLSTYPAATQDLTLVVGSDVPAGDVLDVVRSGSGSLLESARIVDDYRGTGLEEGQKALTFALRFRADDRTLRAEEASEAKLAGVAAAEAAFGAKLRE